MVPKRLNSPCRCFQQQEGIRNNLIFGDNTKNGINGRGLGELTLLFQ
jgi:hypothetical protein